MPHGRPSPCSENALVFKVKPFPCRRACVEFGQGCGPPTHELLVGVLLALLAADKVLKERQRQEGVEEHDKQDVEIGVVVRPPEVQDEGRGGADGSEGAGRGACRGIAVGTVPDVGVQFLQNHRLAVGEQSKKEGPVHGGKSSVRVTEKERKRINELKK